MNQSINCDFMVDGEPCGKIAIGQSFDGTIADVAYHMDFCEQHKRDAQKMLLAMGAKPSHVSVGRKRRAPHVAKSGTIFSTADARAWLIRNDYLSPETKGRVAQELLDLYGENH